MRTQAQSKRAIARKSAYFSLSPRGEAALHAYQSHVGMARGSDRRQIFETARGHWAACHGLEPDDGAYLVELSTGTSSFRHLGEALAVCGQTVDAVASTMTRLLAYGFAVQTTIRRATSAIMPTLESAQQELETAAVELDTLRNNEAELGTKQERQKITSPLQVAFFRVVAARAFVAKLSTDAPC